MKKATEMKQGMVLELVTPATGDEDVELYWSTIGVEGQESTFTDNYISVCHYTWFLICQELC